MYEEQMKTEEIKSQQVHMHQEIQESMHQKTEEIKKKAMEMEHQVSENIDGFMNNTAEKLDKAAEKIHEAASFFRQNKTDKLKKDFACNIKKNPGKSLLGAIILGFIAGKIIFR